MSGRGRPGEMLLRTVGGCDVDLDRLLEVFVGQRQRFVAILRTFGPDDWAAATRCKDWSAHDIVRHLCDGTAILAGSGGPTIDGAGGFDPRVTPRQWLKASERESPEDTLDRFVATTEMMVVRARDRLADDHHFDVDLGYGPMNSALVVLHGFWDSWMHERDVLLARNLEHPTDGEATFYATAYGIFVAAVAGSQFGDPVRATLELGGDGGGVFDLDSEPGVTLKARPLPTGGPAAEEVTDALAGRGPVTPALGDVPADVQAALSHLGVFFNTPAES